MPTAVVSVEGVLGEHDPLHGFSPLIEGVRFAHTLRGMYRLMLTTVQEDAVPVEYWLKLNGMIEVHFYEELVSRDHAAADLSDTLVRALQVTSIRARGYDIGLFVSADPAAVLMAVEAGIPSLFYAHPSYGWAGFRPDKRRLPTPWQDIEDEVTRQRELKATDPRMMTEDVT
jgi:hypothetical protein